MMTERGVAVDHSTIDRWVQRFAPEMEKRLRWQWRRPQSTRGVPPELISPDECLHGEGVPRCQDKPRWFDTTSRAEATRDRIVGFGRASVA